MNHHLDTLLYGLGISLHTAFCEWENKAYTRTLLPIVINSPVVLQTSTRSTQNTSLVCLFSITWQYIHQCDKCVTCSALTSFGIWLSAYIFHHKSINSLLLSANMQRYNISYDTDNDGNTFFYLIFIFWWIFIPLKSIVISCVRKCVSASSVTQCHPLCHY